MENVSFGNSFILFYITVDNDWYNMKLLICSNWKYFKKMLNDSAISGRVIGLDQHLPLRRANEAGSAVDRFVAPRIFGSG